MRRLAKHPVLVLKLFHSVLERCQGVTNLLLREPRCDVLRAVPIECFNLDHVRALNDVFAAWLAKPFHPFPPGISLEDSRTTQNFQSCLARVIDHDQRHPIVAA